MAYYTIVIAQLINISELMVWREFYYVSLILQIFAAVCVFAIIFCEKLSFWQWIGFLAMGGILIPSFIRTGNPMLILTYILIMGGKYMDIDQLIRNDIKIRVIFSLVLLLLSEVGLVENVLNFRLNGMPRQSLGFSHPNNLGAVWLIICIYYFYLHHKKFRARDYLLILAIGLFVYIVPNSRTSAIMIFVCLLVELIYTVGSFFGLHLYEGKITGAVCTSFPILITVFSYVSAYKYSATNAFCIAYDKIFSSRLYLAYSGLQNYGLTLFGQKIKVITWVESQELNITSNTIDNLYVYLGVNFGVIALIMAVILLLVIIYHAYKNQDYSVMLCMTLIIACGLVENKFLQIGSNILLLYLAKVIFGNQQSGIPTMRSGKKLNSIYIK